jgi:7-cyano-7-deazaguanine synthase
VKQVVMLLSGGMDSAVLLWYLLKEGHHVRALSVNYGQRHSKELPCAATLARLAGVEHYVADLSRCLKLFEGSALTDPRVEVPDGHYAEESMKATVVPNRNMLMLSLATSWAVATKSESVAYAAHAGDHAIYPDCRTEFTAYMDMAMRYCDWSPVSLVRPFVNKTKAQLAALGRDLNVPFGETWSCYKGGAYHCGLCGTCTERKEAFQLAGVSDPTEYQDAV